MAKNTWEKHKEVEDIIKYILMDDPMSINMIKFKLDSAGQKVSYGLVQRRMEAMEKAKIVTTMAINHQVKFWKLV